MASKENLEKLAGVLDDAADLIEKAAVAEDAPGSQEGSRKQIDIVQLKELADGCS